MSHALLAEDEGKTSPDPCRLYFEKRDVYYGQHVESLNAPAPASESSAPPQVEPGHLEGEERPES
jgi:hypothetical protein